MRAGTLAKVLMVFGAAVPAHAQDHSKHADHTSAAPSHSADRETCEAEAARHRAMGHGVDANVCGSHGEATRNDAPTQHRSGMDHAGMDHANMNHANMNHSGMRHVDPVPNVDAIRILPPPPDAGSGPPDAADAIWGAEAMRASRSALGRENGGLITSGLVLDRFEYRARDGEDGYLWDVDAWYGGDIHRIWLESEGESSFGGSPQHADVALLYGRAIAPWFDLQAGVRQDLTGPTRSYLDIGIQGLAPYRFEIEGDLLLSNKGDLTATVEVELDQRVTQRLIVQPRAAIALAAQDVPELGIGAGIETIEAGVRLRSEIAREFAPYVGIEQEWKLGGSADFARARGKNSSVTNYIVGVRFWL